MEKKQKVMAKRLIVSAVLMIAGVILEKQSSWAWLPYVLAYLVAGYDIPLKALRNIKNGQIFDENFLMTIATFGALFVGALEEAVAVMLFYQIGELFNDYAVGKSRKSITALMDINPDYANLLKDGQEEQVDPYEVQVGDMIVVKPGEKVPLDGVVIKGSSTLDTKALTGESLPVEVEEGQDVISGTINLNGVLEVKVTKLFDDSTVAKILELVENASSRKSRAENFITKFARVYTPIVVFLALFFAIVPPVFFNQEWSVWIYRACSFLVVSCPCALVISVPLSFFGGLGAASKEGILLKGSNYLEAVAGLETVVFDKTGTLTTGKFQVTEIHPENGDSKELIKLAALGEYHSNHPIASSVKEAYGQEILAEQVCETEELAGKGIHAVVMDAGRQRNLFIGNKKLMDSCKVLCQEVKDILGTVLYVAEDNQYLGYIVIADTIRQDAPEAVKRLRKAGVEKMVMLTGDRQEVGNAVAEKLGLDQAYGNLLPGDKVDKVEELLKQRPEGKALGFVGDGINDAPVLARADVGIAMGGIGSDAAVEAADMVIMTDEPSKIGDAIAIARKTMGIVKQNIVFAIGIKVLVLILTALGMASMWAAVFADVGVSVLAIMNSIRALYYKK
ncbi:heavy metal translocating P-type ATPase [Lachnoclostridium edouardi]|uniref:heavy metal translocating P-type ATPase n=1 Tax=Lachnoclostridium edouardi TaxID=1926283 RepID=UPI000C7DB5DA|nr:heavy metal translocating P-type ATPase [Lachnoclostridium edouardi]